MKSKFKEFYRYSDDEIKKIWDECIFVFDTNVLLDLYRYSEETSDQYLSILKKIKAQKRIWIPHQVGLEFHNRRIILISELKNSYSEIRKVLESAVSDAQKKIDDKYHKEHPFLNLKEINKELDGCLKKIVETINKNEKAHPDWFNQDSILEELNKILKGNIGNEYPESKLDEIRKDGKQRYSNNIPPGYEDASKDEGDRKYGDLILWYQIIDKAQESKKPIIFITRDKKDDWWWKQSGNTIGPRHELKKEMLVKANVDFHMYDSERFLEYAFPYYKQNIDRAVLNEINRVKSLENRNQMMHKMPRAMESQILSDFIHQQAMLNEEFLQLSRQLDLDEGIVAEFNRNQERIMHLAELRSHEGIPNPMMLEEIFMLQERLQRRIIGLVETKKLTKDQFAVLAHLIRRMRNSYRMCLKYFDDAGMHTLFSHRMQMNDERLQRSLEELERFSG